MDYLLSRRQFLDTRIHGLNTDGILPSELSSLLGIAVGEKCLSNSFGGGTFTLTNTCDNLEAVKKLNAKRPSVQPSWKSVDLITQILDVWEMHDGLPLAKHVYGHQDDKRIGPLSFIEHLNVRMDTHYLQNHCNIASSGFAWSVLHEKQPYHNYLTNSQLIQPYKN